MRAFSLRPVRPSPVWSRQPELPGHVCEEHDVQERDEPRDGIENHLRPHLVCIFAHHLLRRGQEQQQKDRDGKLDAEHHLRPDQPLERIADEQDCGRSQAKREAESDAGVTVLDVVGFAEHPRKDRAARHAGRDARRDAREEQRAREDRGRQIAQQRLQERTRLRQVGDHRAAHMERCDGQDDDRAVDDPADEHRKQGVEELVVELPLHHRAVREIPLPALDDLRMQE